MQKEDPHITGNHPTYILTCILHVALNIPYLHDFTTQLYRRKAKVVQNHARATGHNTTRQSHARKIEKT